MLVLGSVVTVDCAGIAANFAAAYFWSQGSQRQTAAAVFLEQGYACCYLYVPSMPYAYCAI